MEPVEFVFVGEDATTMISTCFSLTNKNEWIITYLCVWQETNRTSESQSLLTWKIYFYPNSNSISHLILLSKLPLNFSTRKLAHPPTLILDEPTTCFRSFYTKANNPMLFFACFQQEYPFVSICFCNSLLVCHKSETLVIQLFHTTIWSTN